MEIFYAPSFTRAYRKLTVENQERVQAALEIFKQSSHDPRLHNHKLKGAKEHVHSLSAGYDLRILYIEMDGHAVVLMIDVGKHEEVY